MSKPVWDTSQPSNSSLGSFIERETLDASSIIKLLVSDPEDKNDPETKIETDQFEDNVKTYGALNEIYIKSNGIANTPWLGYLEIDGSATDNYIIDGGSAFTDTTSNVIIDGGVSTNVYDQYTPKEQSYVFKIPAIRSEVPFIQPVVPIAALGEIGVSIDGVPFRSPNRGVTNIFNGVTYTENKVLNPVQDFFVDGSGIIESDRKFFYHSDPSLLYTKDPSTHSPIIGFAFDGLPIYGPYGYSDPLDVNSDIRIITSSYKIKNVQRANETISDGSFIEDFEYEEGSGDLDQYNTRFCKTPEYPNGIQAYFVTVDPDDDSIPVYPYIIGPHYWGEPITPNGNFEWLGKIDVSVISGNLPGGLRIEDLTIVGTPYSVIGTVTYRFVLRAKNLDGISDRTFTITIASRKESLFWETPAGSLPVGNNDTYYILDNSLIDFQFDAADEEMPTVTYVNYHVPPNGGELPGGVKLSKTGRLYGFTAPIIAVNTGGNNGKYDANLYEQFGYDYGVRPTNGYDSFFFDNQTFDYSDPNRAPRKLNRYYQFVVRASNGIRYVDRTFKIYVVGDDYFHADNDILHVGTNTYTADNTYLRKPIWITPNYIGKLRASNYITVMLDVYDPTTLEGTIGYVLETINQEITAKPTRTVTVGNSVIKIKDYNSIPVKGMKLGLQYTNQVIYTITSVQRIVSNRVISFKLTINKPLETSFFDGEYIEIGVNTTGAISGFTPAGSTILTILDVRDKNITNPDDIVINPNTKIIVKPLGRLSLPIYTITNAQRVVEGTNVYYNVTLNAPLKSTVTPSTSIKIGSESKLPPGMILDSLSGDIYGSVPDQPAITKNYKFTVNAIRFSANSSLDNLSIPSLRTFNIDIMGNIDSVIRFTTDGDLGSIDTNFISNLSVHAVTTVAGAVLTYRITSGKLPPGLTLFNDGTIQGKVYQYATSDHQGLVTFDNNATMFDGGTTNFDRSYKFTVEAKDQFNKSATTKTFNINIRTLNNLLYSNIYIKPFLKSNIRNSLTTFFSDPSIFEPKAIYRASDPAFGIQNELKMLLYPGIESKLISEYVSAFGRSTRKKFLIGNLKKSIAKNPGTNTIVYEIIYLEIIDTLENERGSVSEIIKIQNLNHPITVNQGRRDVADRNINEITLDMLSSIKIQDKVMTADFGGQSVSDSNKSSVFGNSVTNIRKKIAAVGDTERNYLPLWMRTPQSFSGVEQGFTKAVPICYCVPGYADNIMLNIKNYINTSDFDFNIIDYTVDRIIIDSVVGQTGDKYIAFPAREVING